MTIKSSRDVQVHWYGLEAAPLVVLLHDYMGRLPWIDKFARRLAADGYWVAVPDFFAGRTTTNHDDAVALMQERMADVSGAMRVVQEVIGEGRALGSRAVAIVGFSMGVRLGFAYAADHPGVDALVGYYGRPHDSTAHVRVPVLFQLGYDDLENGESEAHAFQREMEQQGFEDVDIIVEEEARHGFQNAQNTEKYDAGAAERAYERTLSFLSEHLQEEE